MIDTFLDFLELPDVFCRNHPHRVAASHGLCAPCLDEEDQPEGVPGFTDGPDGLDEDAWGVAMGRP